MSRKRKYTVLLAFILLLWTILAGYKGYLILFEKDYTGMNALNQDRIQTLLDGRDTFRFAIMGNVRNSMKIFDRRIAPALRREEVDFIISAGNAVQGGSEAKYRILNRGLARSGLPYLLGAGPREVEGAGTGRFYRHFGPLFFAMEAGGASFIFLDSTGATNWDWQMLWLEERLEQSGHTRLKFVFVFHSPLEPEVCPGDEPEGTLVAGKSRALRDLLTRYGATAVFSSGHMVYDRQGSLGVKYFTSGRGGGLLLDEAKGPYQFLMVDVKDEHADYVNVEAPNGTGPMAYKAETLGYFLHSFFYISLTSFLLVMGLIGLLALRVYALILRQENLYRDFDMDESRIKGDPVRVAFFTDNYLPYIGGVPISIQRFTRGLAKRGCQVKIFAPSYDNGLSEKQDGDVYRCRTLFLGRKTRYPVTNIFSRKLEEEFKNFKPDLVHVHHPFWLGNRGRKLARRSGLPVVFTYHTRLDRYVQNVPLPGTVLKEFTAHCLTRWFANRCDAIIAPAYSTEEYLRRLGVLPEIVTIPTGIDPGEYSLISSREVTDFRRRYAGDDEILLISVGRLSGEKNVDFMIDGLRRVRERTTVPFRCILVGDGPDRDRLKQKAADSDMADHIFFTGSLLPMEVVRAYLASDLFVFSSRSETQGMVLVEAMAGGCPVVAVNSSGVHDVVENCVNGFKVPADLESWTMSIVILLQNRELLGTLSRNSREFAEKYSEEKAAEKVLTLYNRTLLGKQGGQSPHSHAERIRSRSFRTRGVRV